MDMSLVSGIWFRGVFECDSVDDCDDALSDHSKPSLSSPSDSNVSSGSSARYIVKAAEIDGDDGFNLTVTQERRGYIISFGGRDGFGDFRGAASRCGARCGNDSPLDSTGGGGAGNREDSRNRQMIWRHRP